MPHRSMNTARMSGSASGMKRKRQSTLSFGNAGKIESGGKHEEEGHVWNELRGLMRFQSKDWLDNVKHKGESGEKLKVAAFDLDHTFIKPTNGAKFPRNPIDYRFLSSKIHHTSCENYPKRVLTRVEAVAKDIGLPIAVFIATKKDNYRKPSVGMWQDFVDQVGGKQKIDMRKSFFVGDAAGRKGDFSNSDLKFSINIDVQFWTPESYFEGKQFDPKELSPLGFDPRELVTLDEYVVEDHDNKPDKNEHLRRIVSPLELCQGLIDGQCEKGGDSMPKTQCMVIMNGSPASGKTTFAKRFLEEEGYVWVNMDTLGTVAKCVKATKAGLESGKSVVVDNTNPVKVTRSRFVQLATAHNENLPVYCVKMQTPVELAQHLNVVRVVNTSGNAKRIPQVAFNSYFKRLVEPVEEEGFATIGSVNFVPYFVSDQEKYGFTRLS